MEEHIPMSQKDLQRLEVLTEVRERRLKRAKAAGILGISPRHFRRVYTNEFKSWDFGPTLAHEYLMGQGSPKISVSAVRTVMIENGLWPPSTWKQSYRSSFLL